MPERIKRRLDLATGGVFGAPMAILSGTSRLAGVIGWPIAHSRSPRLHGYWLERHGIDGAYMALAVAPADFPAAVRGLVAAGFAGANVTLPHKQSAFAICDTVDPTAHRAGAVNTLVFAEGRITGANTDGFGFVENLRAHAVDPAAGPALILGAGGAARAIAAGLMDVGAAVTLCSRNDDQAAALASDLAGVAAIGWAHRGAALGDHALLVNATSGGMTGKAALDMDLSHAPPRMAVADIIYAPLETALMAEAAARGLAVVGGLGMLLHQGRPGFKAWFGVDPVVDQALELFVAG